MQLWMDGDSLSGARCPHFMNAFEEVLFRDASIMILTMGMAFKAHLEVWKDAAMREMAIIIIFSMGTNLILNGDGFGIFEGAANAINLLELYSDEGDLCSVAHHTVKAARDLCGGGERDILCVFSKRIPCSCLK